MPADGSEHPGIGLQDSGAGSGTYTYCKGILGFPVVVVDFSLALDLSEINNRYATAHLDHHILV